MEYIIPQTKTSDLIIATIRKYLNKWPVQNA